MKRLLMTCLVAMLVFPVNAQIRPVNHDESKIPAYVLPDPLDGIEDAETWRTRRRAEILKLFQSQMYGHGPARPDDVMYEVTSEDQSALGGLAIRKEVTMILFGLPVRLLLYKPANTTKPLPVFIGVNFDGNHTICDDPAISITGQWKWDDKTKSEQFVMPDESTRGNRKLPVSEILARGYAVATIARADIEPDYPDGWKHGIRGAWLKHLGKSEFAPDDWGAVEAWAWSLSRALDYLESDKAIDAKRAIVIGHSRMGKAALWAGAEDERFAVTISNESGEGGAALARRCVGETTAVVNQKFPHWFCQNFKAYSDREETLPFDQHEVIALLAPRPVYIASAEGDLWSDPKGEFLAAKNAEPVYRLLGKDGLGVDRMPALDSSVGATIGYHIRSGPHAMNDYDWKCYLDFCDRHLSGTKLDRRIRIETGILEGVRKADSPVMSFKGIRYAAPPTGDLRWREPQAPLNWTEVRQADKFGAPCIQPASPSGRPAPADMSEDCLFLNVWTPAESSKDKLAVLFFIHGGAGFFGSGNMNGEELAKKGIIVITLNYRLGLFAGMGHPELTAESPHKVCGNYGMMDLVAALRWVQNNITAFGGDPSKVTIAGQSSGACMVHYLTTSPVAKGLFRGAIAVSFPYDYLTKPNTIPYLKQKEDNGVEYARIKKAKSLADLRKIPAIDFVKDDPALAAAKLNHLPSGVARDGWAIPLAYRDALDKGLESDVPIMTGMTADDFGPPAKYMGITVDSFIARAGISGQQPDALLALCPPVTTDREASEMAKQLQIEGGVTSIFYWSKRKAKTNKAPVYTYLFEQCVASERGAFHGSDLAYWFNDLKVGDRSWTEEDRHHADQASSYWANFVKIGNPHSGNLPEWKPFDANSPVTMILRKNPASRPIAGADRLKYYQDRYEK